MLETKHSSAKCKEILEDGKGEDSSNPVQNVVNEYASDVTYKQMMIVTSTENQVLSCGPTDNIVVVRDKILHEDVNVHTPLQIPVSRSASAITSKQGVEIAGAVNHVIGSPTHMAKMKVTSTENQVLSSSPTHEVVVRKEILHGDVKVHTPLQIPVPRSDSAVTSKQGVEIAGAVNCVIGSPTHIAKMKVTSTENQVLNSGPTDDMMVRDKILHGDVEVHTPLQIPVLGSVSAVTSKQGVEIAGALNHIIGSPTHMTKTNVTSTENQVLSSGPTDDMVVRKEMLHGDVKVHTRVQIPVSRSASAVTSKQGVEIAGALNHIIGSLIHMAKMKVTSTETQVLSSGPTDDMVVRDKISHGDVKVHTPLQIPVPRSASAVISKQGVEIAGALNHIIGSLIHMAKMKVTSTENQVLSSGPTDDMVVRKEMLHGDVKVHTPLPIPVSRSASAVTAKQGVEIAGAGNHINGNPTHMAKMKVTSTENQVLSSGSTDDMVVRDEILHGDVKVHTPSQIPVPRSVSAVTSKQGVEVAGAVNHVIGSPTNMAKHVMDCMLVEDTSLYEEVEMHKPVQIQELKSSSAVTTVHAVNVATIDHVFSGPVHIIEIETNMGKTHVQSVHAVDVGMETDPLSECSPVFDTTMTLSMKRKLVDQDHTYCKKKLEPWPKQPKCTTSHDVKDEAEQNIDSSDDEWQAEIEEADIDNDSDEDWVPEDAEVESDDEDDSDDEDLDF